MLDTSEKSYMSILKYLKTLGIDGAHPQPHDVAACYRLTIPEPHSDDCALPDSLGSSSSIGGTTVDSGKFQSVAYAQRILPLI